MLKETGMGWLAMPRPGVLAPATGQQDGFGTPLVVLGVAPQQLEDVRQ